jgi:8-oxo-dGTP diphosphatase
VASTDVITLRVAATRQVVSATLTMRSTFGLPEGHLAPGDEIPLLRGRFRVTSITGSGWSAVSVKGRPRRLSMTLTGNTTLTCDDALAEVATRARTAALALTGAPVVVGAAILRGQQLLAQQRSYPPAAAGLWELPGGRVEPNETDTEALRRECQEELGVDVTVGTRLGPDVALLKGRLLRIFTAHLTNPDATPHPHDHAALRWLTPGQLTTVPWLPADQVLLPELRKALRK